MNKSDTLSEPKKLYVPDGPFGDAGALFLDADGRPLPTVYVRGVGHLDIEGDEAIRDGALAAQLRKGKWEPTSGFGGVESARIMRVLTAWTQACAVTL